MLDKIYRSHKSACLIKGITIQSIRKIFAYAVLFDNNVSLKKSWKKLAISSGIALLLSGALAPSLIVKADTTEQKSSPVEVQNDSNLSAEFDLSKLPLNGELNQLQIHKVM